MTKIVRKWFWVWEFEKEEKWLNDMACDGWLLDGVGWCRYTFRSCEKDSFRVRLEMLAFAPGSEEGREYIGFIEGSGAKCVGSLMKWVYFVKDRADGEFELFSDIDSRIRHLENIMKTIGVIGLLNLGLGLNNHNELSLLNLFCAGIIGYGIYRLNQMRERLKKERQLHE